MPLLRCQTGQHAEELDEIASGRRKIDCAGICAGVILDWLFPAGITR